MSEPGFPRSSEDWRSELTRRQDRLEREVAELSAEMEALDREVRELRLQFEHLRRQREATSSNEGGADQPSPGPMYPGEEP
jgi:predicted RNase H-like nuclease (RuvC/YqgF family)